MVRYQTLVVKTVILLFTHCKINTFEYRMFCAHCTLWCFPSCQNDTIPLSRTLGWSCLFLWSVSRLFRFLFRISPSIRCNYALGITLLRTVTGSKRNSFMGGRLPLCNGLHFASDCLVKFVRRVLWLCRGRSKLFRSLSPPAFECPCAVSYTHLTLPTILRV